MSLLSIITVPDPTLRLVSKPADLADPKLPDLIKNLTETLLKKEDPPGVGLSAIQTGNPVRLFITYLPPDPNLPHPPKTSDRLELTAFINPEIVAHSEEVTLGTDPKKPPLEGCLSIPNLYAPVFRWEWIEIHFNTMDKIVSQRYSGFAARVIQHEYDHLDGILFTDHIIGRSPQAEFVPLGPGQKTFFDDGEKMVEVKDPPEFIVW